MNKKEKIIFVTKIVSVTGFLFFSTLIIFFFMQPPETGVGLFVLAIALIASSIATILFINTNKNCIYDFVIGRDFRRLVDIIIGSRK